MKTAPLFAGILIIATFPATAKAAAVTRPGRRRVTLCGTRASLFCTPQDGTAATGFAVAAGSGFGLSGGGIKPRPFASHLKLSFDPDGNAGEFGAAASGDAAETGARKPDFKGFSPGQSTAFGQHAVEWTLLTAPLAAYALSPVIDHKLHYTNNGIWQRQRQLDFEYAVIAGEIGGSLWFGGQSRLGKTFWRSMDASFYTAVTVQAMKYAFSRARPRQADSPDHWFQGNCCQSFPSGEVSFQASAVTPFIAEYHKQYPWIWALEAMPAYDALARMKAHGHWQTDVLAAWAIGTAWGLYAHYEPKPLILSIMPHGIMVGLHVDF